MLREDKLALLAIAVALLGLFILYYFTETQKPISIKIYEIQSELIGSNVTLTARAKKVSSYQQYIRFQLYDGNTISAVLFNPSVGQRALIQENARLKIVGRVTKYNRQIQIQVQEVDYLG